MKSIISNVDVTNRKSKAGKPYTTLDITFSNGYSKCVFLNTSEQYVFRLLDKYEISDVEISKRTSKAGKPYSTLDITFEFGYTKVIFLDLAEQFMLLGLDSAERSK